MVNITVTGAPGSTFLSQGTTGDDMVTFQAAIIGGPANANIGGGGMDTATLGGDSLAALAAAGFDFGVTTADTWTITGDDTFNVDFTSITTSDGFTLEAGTPWAMDNNTFNNASIAGPSLIDGSYAATVAANSSSVAWDGANLTSTALAAWNLISFDGNAAAALATAPSSDGAGTFTIDATGTIVNFTPNTAALAGSNNIGDVLTFTYDMVLQDPVTLATVTVPVTYSIIVGWTAGDDVADVSAATAPITVTEGAPFTAPNGSLVPAGAVGGDDLITGGMFNDTLTSLAGSDTLKGGNGNDILTDAAGVAGDANFLGGGAGDDLITSGSLVGDGDKLVGAGGDDTLFGGAGNDTLNGGGADDMLIGVAGNNTFWGGDGDDTLNGGAGNDTFKAGAGDDVINAGAGSNLIFTSQGDDTINAGGGDDTIVLKPGTGTTTVFGFDAGSSDKFDLNAVGWTSLAQVMANTYELDAANSVIVIDANTQVIIDTATLATLDASDFDFA